MDNNNNIRSILGKRDAPDPVSLATADSPGKHTRLIAARKNITDLIMNPNTAPMGNRATLITSADLQEEEEFKSVLPPIETFLESSQFHQPNDTGLARLKRLLDDWCAKNPDMVKIAPKFVAVYQKKLSLLDLSGCNLPSLPDVFDDAVFQKNLGKVNLSKNNLTGLPPSFATLQNVREVNLEDNNISSLENSPLFSLVRLFTLNLKGNKLKSLPDEFKNLLGLCNLNLMNNELETIPEFIGTLSRLTELLLCYNQLTEVPKSIVKLSTLRILRLDFNQIYLLPDLRSFIHLEVLYANNNLLTAFPRGIIDLKSLKKLNLSNNQIKDIPQNIGDLKSLQILILAKNKITSIPRSITSLTNLTALDLSNNELKIEKSNSQLPDDINNLKKLRILKCKKSNLISLPASIVAMKTLQELNVSDNKLQKIPDDIGAIITLQVLNLHSNKIEALPNSLCNLKNLTTLTLYWNKLTALPHNIGDITALGALDVSNNLLTELPASIGNIQGLTILNLGHNHLKTLPRTLANLTKLVTLDVDDNSLEDLPEEIISPMKQLKFLHIQKNKIKALPENIGDNALLIELFASDNKLEKLPKSIGKLTNLEGLNVSTNFLRTLPTELWLLSSLQMLSVGTNIIEELSISIKNLYNLRWLDASYNRLENVPVEIGLLFNLTSLNISHNQKLTSIPLSLIRCPSLSSISYEGTSIPPAQISNITTNCAGKRVLKECLASWILYSKRNYDFSFLENNEHFADEERTQIYAWLEHLSYSNDFTHCQTDLAQMTCEILMSIAPNTQSFKETFFSHLDGNLEHCGDRAAMLFILIYNDWELFTCANGDMRTYLEILIATAKAFTLRSIIQSMSAGVDDDFKKEEYVQTYLWYELFFKNTLKLRTPIQNMTSSNLAHKFSPDEENNMLADVRKNSLYTLVTLPQMEKLLEQNREYSQEANALQKEAATQMDNLFDQSQTLTDKQYKVDTMIIENEKDERILALKMKVATQLLAEYGIT